MKSQWRKKQKTLCVNLIGHNNFFLRYWRLNSGAFYYSSDGQPFLLFGSQVAQSGFERMILLPSSPKEQPLAGHNNFAFRILRVKPRCF